MQRWRTRRAARSHYARCDSTQVGQFAGIEERNHEDANRPLLLRRPLADGLRRARAGDCLPLRLLPEEDRQRLPVVLVFWEFSFLKEMIDESVYGIAVGCFVDADFPKPDLEIWSSTRHPWIGGLEGVDSYEEFPPVERMLPTRPGAVSSQPTSSPFRLPGAGKPSIQLV